MKDTHRLKLRNILTCTKTKRYKKKKTHTQTYTLFPQPWTTRSEMFALFITESLLRFLSGSRYKRCFRLSFLWLLV